MSIFISIVGLNHYYGSQIFSIDQILKLKKDYENKYDDEAIQVELENVGKVGYVANSPYTVARGTRSAGRIYDTFEEILYCKVTFILKDTVIAEITDPTLNIFYESIKIHESKGVIF